ncbi:MAG: hypothetical protein DIZ80_08175 [endosymbiont of Galathealinum brachiosum]|uniref:Uncharacterized protein n=1 Tax=endosymbiont of Galathealinum brachiosum TaxID=2200906 RepID=A0A370DGQ6_9GAMM|nr:MAG: hypothetical protein DIZ80_08175 [endosymbiont of Galathealinum brachiosum]
MSLPDDSSLDTPSNSENMIKLPTGFSDVWIATQGLPLKINWLKEGRSKYEYGKMFILPYTLTSLPYSNTEESEEWVKYINKTYSPQPAWKYNDARRMGHYKCMSLSAATVINWHTIDSGKPLGRYTSWLSGKEEQGFDHRIIDAVYYDKAGQEAFKETYPLLTLEMDPIEGTPISYGMPAFSQIISLASESQDVKVIKVADPSLPGVSHEMDLTGIPKLKTVKIFDYKRSYKVRENSEEHTKMLKDGLHKYGPLFAGIRVRFASSGGVVSDSSVGKLSIPDMSGHGVVIIGYVEQGDETFFIYRETFGKYDYTSSQGGPSYRSYPAHAFNEAYAFEKI